MNKRIKRTLFLFVAAISTTYFVLLDLLRDPAHVVHELGGDSMKNYFAYLYHSMYGSGWKFTGINYPYGEHVLFLDAQPLISITLGALRQLITWTPDRLNVILNLLMAFSFFLAVVYAYKVLSRFKLSYWWSVVFAVLIVTTSAQNFNVLGGYGLYYAFVTPMIFYWFVCYRDNNSIKYPVYVFLLASTVMFLHPYQLALILVWTLFYSLSHIVIDKSTIKQKLKHVLPMLISVVAAIIIFKLTLLVTDNVTDRPAYPHGLLSYCTTFDHLFKNNNSIYSQYLLKHGIINTIPSQVVGYYGYTGLAVLSTILCFIIYVILQIVRGKGKHIHNNIVGTFSPIWLLIGLAALLFSMGIPFIWGLDFLFDYIASFRQFRALGWFALLFYYVATVFASVLLYGLYKKSLINKKVFGIVAFLVVILIWAGESYGVVQQFRSRTKGAYYNYDFFYSKKIKSWGELLQEHNYTAKDFQAVLHIPYCHIGSEKIWLSRSAWGVCMAMKAGFELQLPLIEANMSRTSWEQTFKQIKIAGGPYTYKELLHSVEDKRPWLLMTLEDEKLNPNDEYIINQAKLLGKVSGMNTYILYPSKLKGADELAQEYAKTVASYKALGDTSICNVDMYYNHYNDGSNTNMLFGKGAALPITDKDTAFEVIDISAWDKEQLYEASAWVLVNDINYRTPNIVVSLFDKDGTGLAKHNMPASESTDVQGLWFRPSLFFNLPPTATTIVLSINERGEDAYYGLDELLIRQVADTLISIDSEGRVMANNHLLK